MWFINNGTVQNNDLSANADVSGNKIVWQATFGTIESIQR